MFEVDADIRRARTPPAALYSDPELFELQKRLFARSWQLTPAFERKPGSLRPFSLLPGILDAELVLTVGEDARPHCLSNVCTHRGKLVVEAPGCESGLRCGYHGRRFTLSGKFVSMPEFEATLDFPSPEDDLPELPLGTLGPLAFTALAPDTDFDSFIRPLRQRIGSAPLEALRFSGARDYVISAHWALYVENYLEGFHVPFVHAALNRVIDYASYRTETFQNGNVQIALGAAGEPALELEGATERVLAMYFFLFPSTMLNVYPWGISLNSVIPEALGRTRIRYETWIWNDALKNRGAGADLHRVELEDDAVVESVQRGVRSPLYHRGRYSPSREVGVHQFHRMLAASLFGASAGASL